MATDKQRFDIKVERQGECLIWTGATSPPMYYGRFWYQKRVQLAHRVSWKMFIGPLADEDFVLHRCDNPKCVEPSHLFLGDHQSNSEDKVTKDRHDGPMRWNAEKTMCPRKHHPYDGVAYRGNGKSFRTCSTCKREYKKKK